MATFIKYYPFLEHLAEKRHNLETDALTIALSIAAPDPTWAQLSQVTQISYNFVVTTPLASRLIDTTGRTSTNTTGTYKLVLPDITITATGGPIAQFRYIHIYNATAGTPTDALIGYVDYGAPLDLADGESLVVDFDPSLGVFTIG